MVRRPISVEFDEVIAGHDRRAVAQWIQRSNERLDARVRRRDAQRRPAGTVEDSEHVHTRVGALFGESDSRRSIARAGVPEDLQEDRIGAARSVTSLHEDSGSAVFGGRGDVVVGDGDVRLAFRAVGMHDDTERIGLADRIVRNVNRGLGVPETPAAPGARSHLDAELEAGIRRVIRIDRVVVDHAHGVGGAVGAHANDRIGCAAGKRVVPDLEVHLAAVGARGEIRERDRVGARRVERYGVAGDRDLIGGIAERLRAGRLVSHETRVGAGSSTGEILDGDRDAAATAARDHVPRDRRIVQIEDAVVVARAVEVDAARPRVRDYVPGDVRARDRALVASHVERCMERVQERASRDGQRAVQVVAETDGDTFSVERDRGFDSTVACIVDGAVREAEVRHSASAHTAAAGTRRSASHPARRRACS